MISTIVFPVCTFQRLILMYLYTLSFQNWNINTLFKNALFYYLAIFPSVFLTQFLWHFARNFHEIGLWLWRINSKMWHILDSTAELLPPLRIYSMHEQQVNDDGQIPTQWDTTDSLSRGAELTCWPSSCNNFFCFPNGQ